MKKKVQPLWAVIALCLLFSAAPISHAADDADAGAKAGVVLRKKTTESSSTDESTDESTEESTNESDDSSTNPSGTGGSHGSGGTSLGSGNTSGGKVYFPKTGEIIQSGIGAAGIALLVGVIFFFWKKRKEEETEQTVPRKRRYPRK